VLQSDIPVDFIVDHISINRSGTAMFLSGSDALRVMFLYGNTSNKDNSIICRTVSVGALIYFDNSSPIRTLQISWHPYSDTHLGILSSDSVFRMFDLSSDLEKPEQEYYLQPVKPGRSHSAASTCPMGFSFGYEHLWDRFSVFVLFSDGSIYLLCPVVPVGSVYRWEAIVEIYNDAHTFGLKSSNSRAVSNASRAIDWLESTFPEITHQDSGGTSIMLRAELYVPFDASLCLQGPLRKVCHGEEDDDFESQGSKCEGRAVSFLYNSISKDSVLVTAWSSGQLQIDALADEIQPVWIVGSAPRLSVDSHDQIHRVAMICESNTDFSVVKLNQTLDQHVWLGHSPPLLRLANVDLALPRHTDGDSLLSLFADSLIPERIFCMHGGGVDSIVLHFLPFTCQTTGKDENVRAPSVYPVFSTCHGNNYLPSPLSGFVALADSFGYSWIVGVTSSQECIVLETKGWDALVPRHIDLEKFMTSDEAQEMDTPDIISKELLSGPKVVLVPQASPNLRSVTADSIEGRSTLHQYFKLFHENYVEYAHKVWFELKGHGAYLKRVVDDQHCRLGEVQRTLLNIEEKQPKLENRINRAVELNKHLEERLQLLRNLPGTRKKPLSRSEREFKAELDRFTGLELDALRSSIETLSARLRKHSQSSKSNASNSPKQMPGRRKNHIPDPQISDLLSAVKKLSLVNSENTHKLKLVESALQSKENSLTS
ncbi:Nuclear pore complex protein nup88, partial [Thalictrum thalictroides]